MFTVDFGGDNGTFAITQAFHNRVLYFDPDMKLLLSMEGGFTIQVLLEIPNPAQPFTFGYTPDTPEGFLLAYKPYQCKCADENCVFLTETFEINQERFCIKGMLIKAETYAYRYLAPKNWGGECWWMLDYTAERNGRPLISGVPVYEHTDCSVFNGERWVSRHGVDQQYYKTKQGAIEVYRQRLNDDLKHKEYVARQAGIALRKFIEEYA